ncbi:MAG TPA: hypothetical protein DEP46_09625 [Blastocatellia bacterium]|nr:hypothetical protein [Blastocatellia bacterium]
MVLGYFKRKLNEWRREKQRVLEESERAIWMHYHSTRSLDDIAAMTGSQFEEFLARLLSVMGYSEIRMTPSNDQGGDLICISPNGVSTVVQAKRWNRPVGNKAVQEVLGAMRHYRCNEGIVVTNSNFTPAAVLLANSSEVTLWDNRWLQEQMNEFLPASVPEFNQDEFDQIMKGYLQITRQAASEGRSRKKRFPDGHQTLSQILRSAGQAKGKELTVDEIRKLARLHLNLADADAKLRENQRRLQEAQARKRALNEQIAELDEALSIADNAYTDDDSDSRRT